MKFTKNEKEYLQGQIKGLLKEVNQECGFDYSYMTEKIHNINSTIIDAKDRKGIQ